MSTVKISALPQSSPTTNTANTIVIGVNKQTSVTSTYSLDDIFSLSNAYAQAAFLKANTPSSVANSAGNFANGAFLAANSGATFANGSFDRANASYASQNTTAAFANGAYVTANASYASQNTTATFANASFLRANSGYGQANSSASFANGAFVTANASYASQNTTASFANGAFVRANSGYGVANTALQNTSNIVVNTNLLVPGSLTVTGPFYSANTIIVPLIFPSSQTAMTISFIGSAMAKANIEANLTISLSDYIPGKSVDVIVTNTSGQQRTITHGVTAINSSVGATTFNLAATRSCSLRYFSFGDNLANTYASISYS
jgi:hypothetical protein